MFFTGQDASKNDNNSNEQNHLKDQNGLDLLGLSAQIRSKLQCQEVESPQAFLPDTQQIPD